MKLSRRNSAARRARKRGAALEETLATAALLACFVAPVATAAKAVGPNLANDMNDRIQAVSSDDADGKGSGSGGGLDFGMFESAVNSAIEIGQGVANRAAERGASTQPDDRGGQR